MSPKQSLTATNLAVYQHLSCDLYIHNVYNGTGISNSTNGTSSPSELSKAQYQRGLDWEGILYSWLDRSDLLLKVPAIPLEASTLLENILADGRKHFYITGLTFWPPKHALEKKFRQMGSEPLTFGLAKPDLLEIIRIGDEVQWRVIDAKASKHVKPSHHIQIYFYTLCLNHLLRQPPFHWSNSAGVWLPPNDGFDVASPSIHDIKTISMTLLAPPFDTLLFRDLPRVITSPFDEVKWHYNPLCRGCRYETDCRTRAEKQGELGSMPNISIDDAKALKDLLRISRTGSFNSNASNDRLTDIEDLHELVRNQTKFSRLSKSSPTIVKKTKQILSLPKKIRAHQEIESPIVKAARTKSIQVIPRRNYTCPSQEDTAVMISIVDDPSSPSSKQSHFHVSAYPKKTPISCSATDIVSNLANLIRLLEAEKTTSQFYVWSSTEQALLQTHIIRAALTSSASNDDVRVCIGALAQGASLLQTTFQPILLSGALLTFLGKGKRTKAEYKVCLQRMGLPTDGTVEVLRKRIEGEIKRLQEQSGTAAHHERRKELGQLARVVALKKEVERQLALPIPGYWDLPECAATLNKTRNLCPTDEQVFTAYKHADMETLEYLLTCRNASMFVVLKELRKRAVSAFSGASFLVNEAKVLSTQFMDICKEPHIRKLFFMQQFEVLAKLTELWQSRIDSCPEAPTLEFIGVTQGRNGIEYTFRLISGTVDVPSSDKEYAFFDKLLVEDTPSDEEGGGGDNLPVEVLFDDLGVSGLLFPLNRYTKLHWEKQHARVQQEILVADVRNVYMDAERQHTMVSVRTWGTTNKSILKQGSVYRLSPRLVDFNTTKILSALFEIDLTWESEKEYYGEEEDDAHYGVPFLQLIIDPASFGGVSGSADAKQYVKTEGDIQKLFRDLKGLGNEKAGSLVLKASQHRATQRILSNRLSVIWGPPGTGKTYTISLSLLRLIEVERRLYGPRPKIVFITAITHAAIEACRTKLLRLMDAYRSIENLPRQWLEQVKVEVVTKGSDHPAPTKGGTSVHVYAGTIYQLYNFTKKHKIDVDLIIVDEAGQISLGSLSLVLRCLTLEGRIIIAGDSEQLAPILSAQYPLLKTHALFGSVLDSLMFSRSSARLKDKTISPSSSMGDEYDLAASSQGTIVQLTENFRLNPDLGEFVSTIYSRQFKPQKVQARQLAAALGTLAIEDLHASPPVGIPLSVLEPVQSFLVALSDVMYKQPQTVLVAPEVHSVTPENLLTGTSEVAVTHRPVSLALIQLKTSSLRTFQVGYEMHVHGEAAVAAALVMFLHRCCPDDNIFVATPHRIQREAVKSALSKIKMNDQRPEAPIENMFSRLSIDDASSRSKITVDTIERLQGSEASFVICLFSLPRASTTDLGFLLERRRLNVAISRAKTLCILISSEAVLCPSVKVLANEETAKGYAFLKAYEQRAWSYSLNVNVDTLT